MLQRDLLAGPGTQHRQELPGPGIIQRDPERIQRLRHRSRATDFAKQQDFYLKVAAFVGDAQHVANAHFACGFSGAKDSSARLAAYRLGPIGKFSLFAFPSVRNGRKKTSRRRHFHVSGWKGHMKCQGYDSNVEGLMSSEIQSFFSLDIRRTSDIWIHAPWR